MIVPLSNAAKSNIIEVVKYEIQLAYDNVVCETN